ncbi:MAG: hypothetical protein VZR27_12310 [Acutalibacteraceae bacterium]|nr:hypothetical protein [Acutalibacteraceae bacterium]
MAEEVTSIKWHPGFCSAMELEFLQYKDLLDFNREFPLSKEPLRIDLLMIKKIKDVVIDIDIGRLFKTYNIIEYKSPKDGLTIDDYIKTVGYAYLYKGLGATVDAVPLSELTATIVRDTEPTELFKKIQSEGGSIKEKYPGVYYITGVVAIPTQFILTSSLSKDFHVCLRVLSNKASEDDIKRFIEIANTFTEPIDKQNADAVMNVSINANKEVYDKIRKENPFMCQALRELMKEEIQEEIKEAEKNAAQKAIDTTWLTAIKNLMMKKKCDAKTAMEELCISAADQLRYMAML